MGFKAVAKHAPVYVSINIVATEDNDVHVFVADRSYEVVSISEVHSAGDAAGTLMVEKVPSGTAIGSGVDMHTTAFDLNTTTNTPVLKAVGADLVASQASRTLVAGDSLGFDFGGTLNDTYIGAVTIGLKPIPGSGDL